MAKLIICVDGLGHDLVSKENMPFLYEFGKKNNISRLQGLFAFTGIEYCFFTGENPDKSGIWVEFMKCYNSIFNNFLLRWFSFNRKLRNYLGAFLQLLNKRTYIAGLHNIPRDKLAYFDSSVKRGLWKLDFFQNRDFSFYKWPFFIVKKQGVENGKIVSRYESDNERLERLLNVEGCSVYYTQLMELDKVIHKFGKKSDETKKVLRKLDGVLKNHVEKFLKEGGDVIIWSDHGFADVKEYINIWSKLPKRKDYLYFIAGTTVHFWFDNEEAEKEILNVLSKIDGKILDEKTAKKYNIPMNRRYGDLIFYIEKGKYFSPNFYQRVRERFSAMHGYPEDDELNGIFISNIDGVKKNLKMNEVVDILK